MHIRVMAGVGAWLLGVGAATASSLLAVSLLGQGITTSMSQQLTAAAVQNALAAETSEPQGDAPAASFSPPATRAPRAEVSATAPQIETRPSARPSGSRPAASPRPQPTAAATPSSSVLSSPGGTVVASCRPGGAYLVSWSPAPGYEAGAVLRGPADTARVTFESSATSVTMLVSCASGAPAASSITGGPQSNDSGGPGDE